MPTRAVVTTSYRGNTVTVTDQTGKKRRSVTDALGRLIRVDEPDTTNNLGDISAPVQPTSYSYDVLDNLLTVNQGTQTRTFVYDSLKRLTSAANPESGTINYSYDPNGNLLTKTDARGITLTYQYDALNRNTTVNYSNTTVNPDITRVYDTATDGKGRLHYSYAGGDAANGTEVELTRIDSYDALGRPTTLTQQFKSGGVWSVLYQSTRGYNLAGGVTTQSYPSGHTVNYSFDNAGRTSAFSGNLGDGTPRSYSTGIIYSPLGGMTKEQFGTDTPLFNKAWYNSRGQLSEIRVSTSYTGPQDTSWNRGSIINHYSNQCWGMCGGANSTMAMTDNDGNLKKQHVDIPVNDQISSYASYTSWFSYDSLNRLQETHGERWDSGTSVISDQWKQSNIYDRYGNRRIDPNASATFGVGINNRDFTVNAANNRLGVPTGQTGVMTYDNAGNLTNDTYTGAGARNYDAENRMVSAAGGQGGALQYYTYNADGQRTRRKIDGVETWQVYGFDGELLAEYAANAAAISPQKEYGYRNGKLLITADAPRTNYARSANGATATASSTLDSGRLPIAAINGDRKGIHWGTDPSTGSGWHCATNNAFPDWLQVDFASSKTIHEIDVFTVQDNYTSPVEPTELMTFASYGITAFDVQYWSGSTWVTVSGGSVTGNNKIGRRFTFAPVTTAKIRVLVNNALAGYSRIVEVEAWGATAGAGGVSEINWLVSDQLGTPRMIFDKTGSLANVKRHDYLPFGEELFAGVGGRSTALGYTADSIRQKFTRKERDIETGLDYFGARYYASMQGRFTGADPYDINLERQETEDPREANALFRDYIDQPQHWNHYAYALNNPLKYIDPDGLYEYETELLGKKIKVHIDDKIIKNDKDALNRIKDNLQKAFDKINSGAEKLSQEQIQSIQSMKKVSVMVKTDGGMNGSTFEMKQRSAENPNIDKLAADMIHDSRHGEQFKRGLSYSPETAFPMEMEASSFTVGVLKAIGTFSSSVVQGYEDDARNGHGSRSIPVDKSTPRSRAKVFEKMKKPR